MRNQDWRDRRTSLIYWQLALFLGVLALIPDAEAADEFAGYGVEKFRGSGHGECTSSNLYWTIEQVGNFAKKFNMSAIQKRLSNMEVRFDESEVVVVDMGSGFIKAGYSGEDLPRVVIPTVIGEHENTSAEDSAAQTDSKPNK